MWKQKSLTSDKHDILPNLIDGQEAASANVVNAISAVSRSKHFLISEHIRAAFLATRHQRE